MKFVIISINAISSPNRSKNTRTRSINQKLFYPRWWAIRINANTVNSRIYVQSLKFLSRPILLYKIQKNLINFKIYAILSKFAIKTLKIIPFLLIFKLILLSRDFCIMKNGWSCFKLKNQTRVRGDNLKLKDLLKNL